MCNFAHPRKYSGVPGIGQGRLSGHEGHSAARRSCQGPVTRFFKDGTIALLDPAFLYANRNSDGAIEVTSVNEPGRFADLSCCAPRFYSQRFRGLHSAMARMNSEKAANMTTSACATAHPTEPLWLTVCTYDDCPGENRKLNASGISPDNPACVTRRPNGRQFGSGNRIGRGHVDTAATSSWSRRRARGSPGISHL
jgi:hypothetical protein